MGASNAAQKSDRNEESASHGGPQMGQGRGRQPREMDGVKAAIPIHSG